MQNEWEGPLNADRAVYLQDTFGNGGAHFISPDGYLQLNSWHLHKYLVVETLRLISAPCKGHGQQQAWVYLQVRCICVLQFAALAQCRKGHLSKRETAVSRAEQPNP